MDGPGSGSFKEQILVTYFNNFYYYASLLLDVVEQDNLGGSQSVHIILQIGMLS